MPRLALTSRVIAGLHFVQQSLGGLSVGVGMEGGQPLGGSHHGNALGLLAIGDEVVHLVLHGLTAHLLVGSAADIAQLQHIAQQGKAALAGILPEHGQRGFMLSGLAL